MTPTIFLTSCLHALCLMASVVHGRSTSASSSAQLVYWNSILQKTPIPTPVHNLLYTGTAYTNNINSLFCMLYSFTYITFKFKCVFSFPIDVRNPFEVSPSICEDDSILFACTFCNYNGRYNRTVLNINTFCPKNKISDTDDANFFLESALAQKSSLKLHFYLTTALSGGFMDRSVADSIPISSQNLPNILKRFSVEPNSMVANMIKESIEDCEIPALPNEKKLCATSLESMVDFATSILETTNVKALSTVVLNKNDGLKQRYSITSSVLKGTRSRSVACHPSTFPYALYFCHTVHNTRTYSVSLVGENGSKIEAIASCHQETSDWSPEHISFRILNVKPGEGSICHFLAQDSIAWIASE
ncbi:BURP domain-containing protein [Zostera marina]|uniref:BURP domain-containing protein n=1 Tax=Zostera marina TaxID=29655 RepID=A0A0K9NLI0_ZOSMR|nr:BURP domain-containing protein [Zostera marina]